MGPGFWPGGARPAILAWLALSWAPPAFSATRSFEIQYRLEISGSVPAGKILAWVPLPHQDREQELLSWKVVGASRSSVVEEEEYGNRFIRLDLAQGQASEMVVFQVGRKDLSAPGILKAQKKPSPRYLQPDALVPLDGQIAQEARRVAGSETETLSRVRRVYNHVVETVRYDKSGQGWGRGDALYACDVRAGNCTDFHSLFIGQVRSLKIPARFVMGLSIPEGAGGKGAGYHCWAEFFDPDRGWIPVDASEASKNPSLKDFYFGNLDSNRVAFTRGRDIRIPGARSGPLNYVIRPLVEASGRPLENVEWSWTWRELPS